MVFPLFTVEFAFTAPYRAAAEASRGVSAGLAVAVGAAAGIWITGGFVSCRVAAVSIPNLLGQRHVTVQLLAVARHNSVNAALPLRRVKLLREHLLEHVQGDRRGGGSPGEAPSSAEMVFC